MILLAPRGGRISQGLLWYPRLLLISENTILGYYLSPGIIWAQAIINLEHQAPRLQNINEMILRIIQGIWSTAHKKGLLNKIARHPLLEELSIMRFKWFVSTHVQGLN